MSKQTKKKKSIKAPVAAKPAAGRKPEPAAKATPRRLDVDTGLIETLAKLLKKTDLSEIEWSEGGVQVRVARSGGGMFVAQGAATSAASAAPPAAAPAVGNGEDDYAKHPGAVKSPMVGTAYHAPEPGAQPFARPGDTVSQGQTVMIVEAMKTMNPIPAHKGGRVKLVLVANGEPVEYGQPLVVIE